LIKGITYNGSIFLVTSLIRCSRFPVVASDDPGDAMTMPPGWVYAATKIKFIKSELNYLRRPVYFLFGNEL